MKIDGLVLTFLINAVWQIPVLLAFGAIGARLLRRGPARFRHALWLGVLAASVLLPLASLLPREPAPHAAEPGRIASLSGGGGAPGWSAWVPRAEAPALRMPGGLARSVVLLYGLSLAAHGIRLARAWRRTERLARGSRAVPAEEVPEPAASVAARCREAFGLEPVRLFRSSAVDGPVTLGARRPAILLPPAFLDNAPADHLTAALCHEMAHIRRRDFLVNLLSELWLLPVAFHPAVRWLRLRLAGELSPFMGVWTGELSPEPGVTLPASNLVIQEAGGHPIVSLTWFRHRRQANGSVETVPVQPRVFNPRVTGRTLRFRTRAEMQYRPNGPKETVELDQVFELQGRDQGRLRQVWSSLEGRNDVPPPPPPTILRRRATR